MLVYDLIDDWWSTYDLPANCFTSFPLDTQARRSVLLFGRSSGANYVDAHPRNLTSLAPFTNDDGAAIESFWRGGFTDHGIGDVKTMREIKLVGSGIVSIATSVAYETATGTADSIDMTDTGNDSALVTRLARRSHRGRAFSTYLHNDTLDQAWAVHRLAHHVRGVRIPSVTAGKVVE